MSLLTADLHVHVRGADSRHASNVIVYTIRETYLYFVWPKSAGDLTKYEIMIVFYKVNKCCLHLIENTLF